MIYEDIKKKQKGINLLNHKSVTNKKNSHSQ